MTTRIRRSRGCSLCFVASVLLLATSSAAASRSALENDGVAVSETTTSTSSSPPLRTRRRLVDVMPWDTVADQPGSVAKTDVVKDPRDPSCYDCARLGKKGNGSGGGGGSRVDPEGAAEDLSVEGGSEGAAEAAEVVVVVDEGSDGSPDLLFVAPSTAPSPAPAPAVSRSSRRRGAASAEEGDDVGPLPSP